MTRYTEVKQVLMTATEEDLGWLGHGRVPGQKPDPIRNPWMPFQAAEFTAMLAECVAASAGSTFLDIGSGIGTKVMLASHVFGLAAFGIETDEAMVRHAHANCRPSAVCDALSDGAERFYGAYDIIWMYRPFRDGFFQAQLEHKVFDLMKPGAIIAGANWENKPSGFEIVLEDLDENGRIRGAWKKPLKHEPVIYDLEVL